MRNSVGRFAALATVATLFAACSGGGDKGTGNGNGPLAVAANGATSFSASAGSALSGALPSVRVSDANSGAPRSGVSVTFSVTGGGGSISGATQTTNAQGIATVGGWTLGTTAGVNSLRAQLTNESTLGMNFTATGEPGTPARLSWSVNPASNVTAGETLGQPPARSALVVDVLDQFGNIVTTAANITVTVGFSANPGGATLGGTVSTVAANGRAAFGNLTVNKAAANYSLSATSPGLASATSTSFTVNAANPASMTKQAGDNGTGTAGSAVAVKPTVLVNDAFGNPVQNATVVFAVASGGGSVTGATQQTNAQGVATVGGWTLGSAGTNTLTATVSGAPVATFTVQASAASSAYNIDLRYVGPTPDAAVQSAFAAAASRWSQLIVGDLPDVSTGTAAGPGSCGQANFPDTRNQTIDDIIIYAEIDSIDGVGRTLGSAGPCFTVQGKTVIGYMRFDRFDMPGMAANGTLTEVIVHEMGHVVGIGTLWSSRLSPTVTDTSLIRTTDIRYTGTFGNNAYFAFGSGATGSGAPIENCGTGSPSGCGPGNWLGHWRETFFRNELMTGFISASGNPISRMTVGALADIGYVVNYNAADAYSLPTSSLFSGSAPRATRIDEAPWNGAVYEIDRGGRILKRLQ